MLLSLYLVITGASMKYQNGPSFTSCCFNNIYCLRIVQQYMKKY